MPSRKGIDTKCLVEKDSPMCPSLNASSKLLQKEKVNKYFHICTHILLSYAPYQIYNKRERIPNFIQYFFLCNNPSSEYIYIYFEKNVII